MPLASRDDSFLYYVTIVEDTDNIGRLCTHLDSRMTVHRYSLTLSVMFGKVTIQLYVNEILRPLSKVTDMSDFDSDCEQAKSAGAKAASLDECPYSADQDPLLRAIWQDAFVTAKLYRTDQQ